MTDYALERTLDIGESLTQAEVEDVFNTDFGYQFRGITYRNPNEGKYIILLSNEGEFYNDQVGDGDDFVYEGEGDPTKGDQKLTNANNELRKAATDPIPIYFFQSTEGEDEYEYQGLVEVLGSRYVSDGHRMVFKYKIRRLGVASWKELQNIERELLSFESDFPSLTEDTLQQTTGRQNVRDSAFSRQVKKQFENTCAFCGARRFSPTGQPEVEAAHIYPKSENGADNPRNGIALCKFHHWAFDAGWLAIADDLTILVRDGGQEAPPEELQSLEGERLRFPNPKSTRPHQVFIEAHREYHGFD